MKRRRVLIVLVSSQYSSVFEHVGLQIDIAGDSGDVLFLAGNDHRLLGLSRSPLPAPDTPDQNCIERSGPRRDRAHATR